MKILLQIFFLLFFPLALLGQSEQPVTIVGDSLVGKISGGEKIREVIGNVKITKGDVLINSDIAVQHIASGNIELKGNVVFTRKGEKLFTEKAFYQSKNNFLRIDTNFLSVADGDTLTGAKGSYSKTTDIVTLSGGATLVRSAKKLDAENLIYFRKENKIVAAGNVHVLDSASVLSSDSLIYFPDEKLTFAFNDVSVENRKENFIVYGDALIDSGKIKTTEITGEPLLEKVDSTSESEADTLFVLSEKMRLVNDSSRILIASGDVRILRANLSLAADSSFFDISANSFAAIKTDEFGAPVKLWFKKNQVSGDSVFVALAKNELKDVIIKKNALLVSILDSAHFRFNQISGSSIKMSFACGRLMNIFVDGNVLSIYYLYDKKEANGLIKSSSRSALIELDSASVSKVKLYGTPNSEYHPENLIGGNEAEFVLPNFRLFNARPKRSEFIGRILKSENNLKKLKAPGKKYLKKNTKHF